MAKHFWIYTHNFTNSGAPLVMAAIARELAASGWRKYLHVLSWGGLHDQRHSSLQYELMAENINCTILNDGEKIPAPSKNDRLLMNSVALPESVIRQSLNWLLCKKLCRIDWYCHESDPFFWISDKDTYILISKLIQLGNLQLRVPSRHTLNIYQKWLSYDGSNLTVQNPKLIHSKAFDEIAEPKPSHFNSLRFVLIGGAGSGNKGQLWLLRLLKAALYERPNEMPGFRSIELQLLGLEKGKYAALSRDLVRRGEEILGDAFSWCEETSRDKLLAKAAQGNLLVNCSLKETFSCVCSEGMALGLPLLRMRNGGFHEQLIPWKTGFDLGIPSPKITANQLELINCLRDPEKFPEKRLLAMAQSVKNHARQFSSISYQDWLFL